MTNGEGVNGPIIVCWQSVVARGLADGRTVAGVGGGALGKEIFH